MITALLLAAAAPDVAPADDRRAIVAVIERFFDGLAAKDLAAIMATVVPGGSVTAHVVQDGKPLIRTQSWQEWAAGLAKRPETLHEKMYAPDIRVRGTMASVWTEYDFHINGRFSHCGIDNFDMAKVDGSWRIVSISFTRETQGCPKR